MLSLWCLWYNWREDWKFVDDHRQHSGTRCQLYSDDIGTSPVLLTTLLTALRHSLSTRLNGSVTTPLVYYLHHQLFLRQRRHWRNFDCAHRLRYGESSWHHRWSPAHWIPYLRLRRHTSAVHYQDDQRVAESRSTACLTEACNHHTTFEETGSGFIWHEHLSTCFQPVIYFEGSWTDCH